MASAGKGAMGGSEGRVTRRVCRGDTTTEKLTSPWRLLKCRLSEVCSRFLVVPGVGSYGDGLVFFSGAVAPG